MDGSVVLLIDDDSIFTDVIGNRLRRDGLQCEYAPQGSVAFDLLAKGLHPDVILLDIVMPDMSGFEVLTKLKSDPATKEIPVIMFSNEFTADNKKKASQLGAADFLEKVQVTPAEVAEAVRRYLQRA